MRNTNKRLLAAALLAPMAALATPAQASEDGQYWQTATVNVALPGNFKLQNEAVFRSSDARGFYEMENSLLIGHKIEKNMTLWMGYVFNPQYSHGDFQLREHRFRQQLAFDNLGKIGRAKVTGRLRMEERWREGQSGTGWRLRPAVKVSMPFIGKTTIAAQHESFVNLNTTTFQRTGGYERMRNSVAVTVPLSKPVNFDFGYLNQHGFVRNGPDTSDHVFTLGLAASF